MKPPREVADSMADLLPERIWAVEDTGAEEGVWNRFFDWDGEGVEYVRADLCEATRQQALVDAVEAVEGVRMNSISNETALINFGVDTSISAIRRLMVVENE